MATLQNVNDLYTYPNPECCFLSFEVEQCYYYTAKSTAFATKTKQN